MKKYLIILLVLLLISCEMTEQINYNIQISCQSDFIALIDYGYINGKIFITLIEEKNNNYNMIIPIDIDHIRINVSRKINTNSIIIIKLYILYNNGYKEIIEKKTYNSNICKWIFGNIEVKKNIYYDNIRKDKWQKY